MAEADDFSQLPLLEQFAHKNWKARKGGYETAAKEFKTAQPTDDLVKDFTYDHGVWKNAVGDANAAAQQEALLAYNAFLDAAGTDGARKTRSQTVQPAVEKGLTGRPAAKAAALEAILLLIELDKPDPIIEELLPFLLHKTPKMIIAALSALKEIYHAYGCKTVEPKSVLKLMPKMYGHANKDVRAEAQALTVELYRWLREPMKPLFWGDLKDVQQKDLEKLFEPVQAEPAPQQERLLRSQQAAKERQIEAAVSAAGEEDDVEEEAAIDLEPEFEAVDVAKKLPDDFNDRIGSSKWKDRKEVMDEVFTLVNVPAIQEGYFDDVIRGCAKSMKDANIAVVIVAANVVECLAKGLKKSFGKYRSQVLSSMLERLKEKKPTVTDAIGAACDAVFAATGLSDIQADVLEALKSKNPQVKENSAKFLARALKTTRDAPTPEQTKEIAEGCKKLLTESAAPLRDAGAEVLGVMWKIMGDRNMLAHFEGLDDIRKTKVTEIRDAAEVRAKWKPKAAPPPKAAAAPAGKKPVLGSRRPAAGGVKKAPLKSASPPFADDAPMQPRPTSRPGLKPPGGLRAPGGIKPPSSGYGVDRGKLPASSLASPKRQGVALDDPPQAPATPRAGLGRGLAGRPLAKPSAALVSPSAQRNHDPAASALSAIERQELTDLRAEVDLVRDQASTLRNEKLKLSSQVSELQVQNAQLIEDHTRDVLQIKAKETQLVRARSDAESSEDRANSLSREIDRLKREIARLGRSQHIGRDSPVDGLNGGGPTSPPPRPSYGTQRTYNMPSSRAYGNVESNSNGYANGGDERPSSRALSGGSSGRATPNGDGTNSLRGSQSGGGEGAESWRRAAEVTQNLKARIEMMKARQNIGRGQ